jgi:sugar phosphate permease
MSSSPEKGNKGECDRCGMILSHSMAEPTRVRGRVLTFAFLLTVITYLDRVCISAAAPAMMADLGLSPLQMGYVFSAFLLA